MVGVLAEDQNRGVGRPLRPAQRQGALERGINLIELTFDPLQLKNAHFNIEKLGAIVRHYMPNLYGRPVPFTGLPTDRLIAEGWLRSRRMEDAPSRRRVGQPTVLDRGPHRAQSPSHLQGPDSRSHFTRHRLFGQT
jgi:predicted GNAT superfamily acetyltransferase